MADMETQTTRSRNILRLADGAADIIEALVDGLQAAAECESDADMRKKVISTLHKASKVMDRVTGRMNAND